MSSYPLVVSHDKVASHGDIGNVGRGRGNAVDQSSDPIDADMGLHPEAPLVALIVRFISRSRCLAWFLVEGAAATMVASTIAV